MTGAPVTLNRNSPLTVPFNSLISLSHNNMHPKTRLKCSKEDVNLVRSKPLCV
jgi:hypothetical protein